MRIRNSDFVVQAEDGIRDLVRSRGLGDVYKRQDWRPRKIWRKPMNGGFPGPAGRLAAVEWTFALPGLSFIHI